MQQMQSTEQADGLHFLKETRQGLASVLYIVCSCGVANDVHTSSKQRAANGKLAFGVNIMASAGLLQIGMMAYIVQNFFSALNIPMPVPPFEDGSYDTSSGFIDPLGDINFQAAMNTTVTDTGDNSYISSKSSDNLAETEDADDDDEEEEEEDEEEDSSAVDPKEQDKNGHNKVCVSGNDEPAISLPVPVLRNNRLSGIQVQQAVIIVNASATENRYGCGKCLKAFPTEETCRTHIEAHVGSKPFLCEECGRGFTYTALISFIVD
ncbi:hypothetical protein C0Q70_12192 [Pomacea canaliculata]|uniref:C2H2-type domain-containing protein n=1 Tax=Pomacea canaliculata TaxID=400727 RepID=A0A2T7P0U3_POMCA|nr:hypothetical protein C0Q70_12192 [Pomacea canaliculata]